MALTEPLTGDGGIFKYSFSVLLPLRFFRLRVDKIPSEAINPEELLAIPSGDFMMGSPPWEPGREKYEILHEVTISRSFIMAKTEVGSSQLAVVMNWALENELAQSFDGEIRSRDEHQRLFLRAYNTPGLVFNAESTRLVAQPGYESSAATVAWYGAMVYCYCLNILEGKEQAVDISGWTMNRDALGYRLPTEAELECACRAHSETAFYIGPITHTGSRVLDDNLDKAGWYGANRLGNPGQTVALKLANDWGSYDMHGNTAEWCFDVLRDYDGNSVVDPLIAPPIVAENEDDRESRVLRGAGFDARQCRSAYRHGASPKSCCGGIRLVVSASPI